MEKTTYIIEEIEKGVDFMTNKEAYNIIQGLKKLGADNDTIVKFIEYIETSDPEILKNIPNLSNESKA